VTLGRYRSTEAPDKKDGGLKVVIQREWRGVRRVVPRSGPRQEFLRRAPISLRAERRALRSLIKRGKRSTTRRPHMRGRANELGAYAINAAEIAATDNNRIAQGHDATSEQGKAL
jgi:hypothetical protein